MQTLLVLRHGKSSWKEPGLTDHERPLNGRGRRDAPRMGRLLRAEGLAPERIVSSTAVRARMTAELVADAVGYGGAVEQADALYLADAQAVVGVLRAVGGAASRLLVVGHNPGLEELVAGLTARAVTLPTAALAHIRLDVVAAGPGHAGPARQPVAAQGVAARRVTRRLSGRAPAAAGCGRAR